MVRFNLQLFAKSVDTLAKEVIKGNWGNGDTRKTKLTNAGYDYSTVQTRVNEMLGVGGSKPSTPKTNTATAGNQAQKLNTASTPQINGVDPSLVDTINSKYTQPAELTEQQKDVTQRADAFMDFASNTNIISDDVWAGMMNPYSKSEAVLQAEQMLKDKMEKGYAGTYKDSLNNLINDFMNREDFEYDVDKDQMFQQALASAMNSGKSAMQHTMGQAAALTGGYGSTYATSAGNQAYNAFIEDAYNNLPEYYNMALAAYEAESQQMLQQYSMLDAADTKEYGRWYDDINMQYQQTRDMVNDDYNQWNANQSMYANIANMQLSENAQIGNNMYNAYNVASNEYENAYAKDWQNWQQSIDSAYKMANMQSNDYWNTENLNSQKEQARLSRSSGSGNKTTTLTNTELEKVKEVWAQSGGDPEQVDNYLTTIGKNDLDDDANAALMAQLTSDPAYQDWTISKDTFNWFWGDDNNDEYTNGTTTMTYADLRDAINNSSMPDAQKKAKLKALKEQQNKK